MKSIQISSKKQESGRLSAVLAFLFFTAVALILSPDAFSKPGEHSVGLGVGQVMLMSDWSDSFSDTIGFQANYGYEASDVFGVLVNVGYQSHEGDGPAASMNSLKIKSLVPNLKANFAYIDQLVMYGLAGLGFYHISETVGVQKGSVTTLGLDLGGGTDLYLGQHLKFGLALTFQNIFHKTDPDSAVAGAGPLSIGGTFLKLFLNFGVVF